MKSATRCRAAILSRPRTASASNYFDALANSKRLEICAHQPRARGMCLDENRLARPAADGLDPDRARARIEINEQRSSTAAPRMLKSVSRSRSLVGRRRSFPGPFNCRLRNFPAITRMASSCLLYPLLASVRHPTDAS